MGYSVVALDVMQIWLGALLSQGARHLLEVIGIVPSSRHKLLIER